MELPPELNNVELQQIVDAMFFEHDALAFAALNKILEQVREEDAERLRTETTQ